MKRLFQHLNLSHVAVALLMLCSCKEDRTTVVFGKVIDQDQRPVDSIMVVATGSRNFTTERIQHTFTDNDGKYTITIDVPKRYHAIHTFIPHLPAENPKYEAYYKTEKIFKDGVRTNNCCIVRIGEKTQWDFELAPK
ncbi:hypothetical protein [Dyadobacter fermentans]|uniref:hypothetical protein n=1 Tax=Dyadobacter fermentans TaxID=94254 RepID=UPI00019B594E|nr:hypothetical protein [Dyadobacter fermentans]